MIVLDELNRFCASRVVANDRPAQVLCRLLGNRVKPCSADPLCRVCDRKGVWVLYSALSGAILLVFFVMFWLLRVTRLSRVLGAVGYIFIPPLRWAFTCLAEMKRFYNGLPG